MAKFNFEKLKVDDKIFEFPINQIDPIPVLKIKPATESNRPYFNAVLLRTKKIRRAKKINSTIIKESREDDRKLFSKHIVVGWDNVTDTDGNKVPYSEENCADFLQALPDYIFDEIRAFASDPEEMASQLDNAEETAEK